MGPSEAELRPRKDIVWRRGERAAWEAYRRMGYRLLARNWRCPLGELDLVVSRDGVVVFCEVKARSASHVGGPHDAVGPAKRRKVRSLAEAFLAARRIEARAYRFDVASVTMGLGGRPGVHVFEDAF